MSAKVKILLGPAVAALCIFVLPFSLAQNAAVGIALWMVAWWSTQVLPIGATALLPLVMFPAFGVSGFAETASNYANPIIFLFFGGFVLGLALEKRGLHRRFALHILRAARERPFAVIAGFSAASAILSMWISNTATAVMMLPIGISVIHLLEKQFPEASTRRRFAVSLLLSLAVSANIGGTATLIGTPPNLVLAGILSENYGREIGFAQWFFFTAPLAVALFFVALLINTKVIFRVPNLNMYGMRQMTRTELEKMGHLRTAEKRVALVFLLTAGLWIFRAPLSKLPGLGFVSDALIAVFSALLLFSVGDGRKKRLMGWEDMKRMPWDILLLFGGGLSIAAGLTATGTVELLGSAFSAFDAVHWLIFVLFAVAVAVMLTELMSNVAMTAMLLPVVIAAAEAAGGHMMTMAVALTIGASCAFMLPIATPPNAVVFSATYIRSADMAKLGFWLNLISIALITAYCYAIAPLWFS